MSEKPCREIAFHESKTEKQPHEKQVRLFEHLTPKDKLRLEALLCGKAPRDLSFTLENGDVIELSEIEPKEKPYAVCASDVLYRLCAHMAKAFPDMELSFTNVNCTDELLSIHVSNLMRICMLCADVAGSYSLDRCLDICLKSSGRTAQAELRFETSSFHSVSDDVRVELARFVSETEKCIFDMTVSGCTVELTLKDSSEPEDMPEFKYADQFEDWDQYFLKVSSEVKALNA